jgi:hypothetical protein
MHQLLWGIVAGLVVMLPTIGQAIPARPSTGTGTITITAHAEYPSPFFREFYWEFTGIVEQWWEELGQHDIAGRWHVSVGEPVMAGQRLPIVITVRKDGEWLVKPFIVPREDSDPIINAQVAAEKTMTKIETWGWKRNVLKHALEESKKWLSGR